jgi:hypothetical protein
MQIMAEGSELLCVGRGDQAIARLPLLIQPLKLLDLTGLEAL